jgi:hypothetical protein
MITAVRPVSSHSPRKTVTIADLTGSLHVSVNLWGEANFIFLISLDVAGRFLITICFMGYLLSWEFGRSPFGSTLSSFPDTRDNTLPFRP